MPIFIEKCSDFQLLYIGGSDGSEKINIGNICLNLGINRCRGLLFFHAFNGCDYNCSFFGVDKKKWFDHFIKDQSIDEIFYDLSIAPREISELHLNTLCEFTLAAYKSDEKAHMGRSRMAALKKNRWILSEFYPRLLLH